MRTAPHLCRPIEFVFPGYRGERPGLPHAGHRHRALQRARAVAPARARPASSSAGELYAAVPHLRTAGLAGAQSLRRLPDRRRAPGARERARRRGRRRARSPTTCASRRCCAIAGAARAAPPLVDAETGDTFEVRAPHRAERDRPLHRQLSGRRRPPACAPPWACTWCSMPRASRMAAARWCCARRATTVSSSSCPRAPRTIVGTTDTDWTPPTQPPAPQRRNPRARRRRRLPARGRQPRVPEPAARRRRRALDARRPAAAARDQRAHALRDVARARDRARR